MRIPGVRRGLIPTRYDAARTDATVAPQLDNGKSAKPPEPFDSEGLSGSGGGIRGRASLAKRLRSEAAPRTPDLRVMRVDPVVGDFSIFLRCCEVRREIRLCWMGLVRAIPPQNPHTRVGVNEGEGLSFNRGGGGAYPTAARRNRATGSGSERRYATACDRSMPRRILVVGQVKARAA